MGKLIYTLNVSLDGFIETPDHSLDWSVDDDALLTLVQRPGPRSGRLALRPPAVRADVGVIADGAGRSRRDRAHARVRAPLAGYPEDRLLIDPDVGRLEQPSRPRRRRRSARAAAHRARRRLRARRSHPCVRVHQAGPRRPVRLVVHPVILGPGRRTSRPSTRRSACASPTPTRSRRA